MDSFVAYARVRENGGRARWDRGEQERGERGLGVMVQELEPLVVAWEGQSDHCLGDEIRV